MVRRKLELFNNQNTRFDFLNDFCNKLIAKTTRKCYLIGECVRDLYLNRNPISFHILVNSDFKRSALLSSELRKSFEIKDMQDCLIVSFNIDGNDVTATIYFDSSPIEEQLQTCGFTINAFAYDITNKELLAYSDTCFKDIKYGIVRAMNPKKQIVDNPLDMLVAIRMCAQLSFVISEDTYNEITENSSLIARCSKEKIKNELTQVLYSSNPHMLELIVASSMEKFVFDGKTPLQRILLCEHNNPWHYTDVFHHTMDVLKQLPNVFELKWAALFHDFGKPIVKKLKKAEENIYGYPNHPQASVEEAMTIMELFEFNSEQKKKISALIKYHDEELATCDDDLFYCAIEEIGKDNFLNFLKLKAADANAHRLFFNTKAAINDMNKIIKRFDDIC